MLFRRSNVRRQKSDGFRRNRKPWIEILEDRVVLAVTFTVNSDADLDMNNVATGQVTLRSAIEEANLDTSGEAIRIEFGLPTGLTIAPSLALPTITRNDVTIDGFTQGGPGNTTLLVHLDGNSASFTGLTIDASNTLITGLVIEEFDVGIKIDGTQEEYDDLNLTTYLFHAPLLVFAQDGNTTSGNTILSNLIKDNINQGVWIEHASRNFVTNNVIGGNGVGIEITGSGDATITNNVASTDDDTFEFIQIKNDATRNTIENNFIGIDRDDSPLGNTGDGILIDGSSYNFIGSAGNGNVISNNGGHGVHIKGTLNVGVIDSDDFNSAASEQFVADGLSDQGIINPRSLFYGPYTRDLGDTSYFGAPEADTPVQMVGGLELTGAIPVANKIQGNTIGTNRLGTSGAGNTGDGIFVESAAHLTVIGAEPTGLESADSLVMSSSGNLIGDNGGSGIRVVGDPLNEHPIDFANTFEPRDTVATQSTFLLATESPDFENNTPEMELIPTLIGGNRIGVHTVGSTTYRLGNDHDGVLLEDTRAFVFGNVISANGMADQAGTNNGLHIDGRSKYAFLAYFGGFFNLNSIVAGNRIGTREDGTVTSVDAGNLGDGVLIGNGAQYNIIGANPFSNIAESDIEHVRNVISGNHLRGVHISGIDVFHAERNLDPFIYPVELNAPYGTLINGVSANYIGTDINGTEAIGNRLGGVLVDHAAAFTLIGNGYLSLEEQRFGNVISGNGVPTDTENVAPGIEVTGKGTAVTLMGANLIGLVASGNEALPNNGPGVKLSDRVVATNVGGDGYLAALGSRNYIAGNDGPGVLVVDTYDLKRTETDESLLGLPNFDANEWPVQLESGTNYYVNEIDSNWIGLGVEFGTDTNGAKTFTPIPIGNNGHGVEIVDASNTLIGGFHPLWTKNTISANTGNGIHIVGDKSFLNFVDQSYIGTDPTGTAIMIGQEEAGNGGDGIYIGGDSTLGYAEHNVISGTGIGFHKYKIDLELGVGVVQGTAGDEVPPELAFDEDDNGNVISGNVGHGIHIDQSNDNVIWGGNYIGTGFAGESLPNGGNGVLIAGESSGNRIEARARINSEFGAVPWGDQIARDVISGNDGAGVVIEDESSFNVIGGAIIGLDPTGTSALGNQGGGVIISSGAYSNFIDQARDLIDNVLNIKRQPIPGQTPTLQAVNVPTVIAGNVGSGVTITGSTTHSNLVNASYIGTNQSGDWNLDNTAYGALITDGAYSNVVQGDSTLGYAGNVLYPNGSGAISLNGAGSGNLVSKNLGSDNDGELNSFDFGVSVSGSDVTLSGTFYAVANDAFTYDVVYYAYDRNQDPMDAVQVGSQTSLSDADEDGEIALSVTLSGLSGTDIDRLYFAVIHRTDLSYPIYYYNAAAHHDRTVLTSLTKVDGTGTFRDAINYVNSGSAGTTPIIDFQLPIGAILRPQPTATDAYLPALQHSASLLGNGVTLLLTETSMRNPTTSEVGAFLLEPGTSATSYSLADLTINTTSNGIVANAEVSLSNVDVELVPPFTLLLRNGIRISAGADDSSLSNISVYGASQYGINISANDVTLTNVHVSNIESSLADYIPLGTGLTLKGSGTYVNGAVIEFVDRHGIEIHGANTIVTNSAIFYAGGDGIMVDTTQTNAPTTISNTTIGHLRGRGINVVNDDDHVVMTHNRIWDATLGFNRDTPLALLNNGTFFAGLPAEELGGVYVTVNSTSYFVDLSSAETIGDVLGLVFSANLSPIDIVPFGLFGRINADRNGIDLTHHVATLQITSANDSKNTAERLKLSTPSEPGNVIYGGDLAAIVDRDLVKATSASWDVNYSEPVALQYQFEGSFTPSVSPQPNQHYRIEVYIQQPKIGAAAYFPPVRYIFDAENPESDVEVVADSGGSVDLSVIPSIDVSAYQEFGVPSIYLVATKLDSSSNDVLTYEFGVATPNDPGAPGMAPLNFGDESYSAVAGQTLNFAFFADFSGEIDGGFTYIVDWGDAPLSVISGMADGGSGTVTVTSTGSNLTVGQQVKIVGTTSYDGVYTVESATTDTFTITSSWNGSESGAWSDPDASVQVFERASDLLRVKHSYDQTDDDYDNGLGVFDDGYTITVVVKDSFGNTSSPNTYVVPVIYSSLQASADHTRRTDLVIAGTNGDDSIAFSQSGTSVTVDITQRNGVTVYESSTENGVTGRVVALGLGGDDTIDASDLTTISTVLFGGIGEDTLIGGDANDLLIGGAGDDSLTGGDGSDIYLFSGDVDLGTDTITDTKETVEPSGGNVLDFRRLDPIPSTNLGISLDLSDTSTTPQEVLAGILSLKLSDHDLAGIVLGTRGDDSISGGGQGAETVFIGGPGDDTLTGTGKDTFVFVDMNGVTGWDIVTNRVNGIVPQGHDTINESVTVTDPDYNVLYFGVPSDVNPHLTWLRPYQAPVDSLDLRDAKDGVAQTVSDSGEFADYLTLTINGVENFNLIVGSSQQNNTIYANDSNSILTGGNGLIHLIGGSGDDILVADPAVLGFGEFGDVGNAWIEGRGGNDLIVGGTGNDLLDGGDGNDTIVSRLASFGASPTLGDGDDTLIGGSGNDTLISGNGLNTLEGGLGNDVLFAGEGDVRFVFHRTSASEDLGSDTIVSGTLGRRNTLDFSGYQAGITLDLTSSSFFDSGHLSLSQYDLATSSTVPLGTNIPNVIGSEFADHITGDDEDNILIGGGGNDTLLGGAGDDLLIGGDGSDSLVGGIGNDILIAGDLDFGTMSLITSLSAVHSEWTSSNSYSDRVDNILDLNGTAGSNGSVYLDPGTTALDDSAVDSLFGGDDDDWFFYSSVDDVVNDDETGEVLTDLAV